MARVSRSVAFRARTSLRAATSFTASSNSTRGAVSRRRPRRSCTSSSSSPKLERRATASGRVRKRWLHRARPAATLGAIQAQTSVRWTRRVAGLYAHGETDTDIESAPLTATVEASPNHSPQPGAALMKRTTKYVGLDVHQATTVAVVRDGAGRVMARTILPTEAAALTAFVGPWRGRVEVAYEEGTQAQWLHDLLRPLVARVVVCDRRAVRRQGNKS